MANITRNWMPCFLAFTLGAACATDVPTKDARQIERRHTVRLPKQEGAEAQRDTSRIEAASPSRQPSQPYGQDVPAPVHGADEAAPIRPVQEARAFAPAGVGAGAAPGAAAPSTHEREAPRRHSARSKQAIGIGSIPANSAYRAGSLGDLSGTLGGGAVTTGPLAQPADARNAELSREAYAHIEESKFVQVGSEPLSTFSIDVDTASYANVRRFLRSRQLPPADAVRIEELVNYFDYAYPEPRGDAPFAVYAEVGACPWNPEHKLVHLGMQAQSVDQENVPARNLVFLVDVSGSMQSPDKLPLLRQGLTLLTRTLRPEDRVAIAVYAGSSGLALPSTSGRNQGEILAALERLEAGGSTNGAQGIELAYREATRHFVKGGINRVILATDGDFNVGITSEGELVRLIEQKRRSGVFLTVLGFGTGNLQDSRMEKLADKGNGNYAYIDSTAEAHKVLVREAGATLVTVAKDVKLQVEWNPAQVRSYRLIGYENRALAAQDFNDDLKDAGEIGAGHNVTALYEIIPQGAPQPAEKGAVDPLRYQSSRNLTAQADTAELLTFKVRYKPVEADKSRLITEVLHDRASAQSQTSEAFRFSAAVAGFGMLLRKSSHSGSASLSQLLGLAQSALGDDPHGDRREFLDMMQAARSLGLGS